MLERGTVGDLARQSPRRAAPLPLDSGPLATWLGGGEPEGTLGGGFMREPSPEPL
jgi:hypothetical protein